MRLLITILLVLPLLKLTAQTGSFVSSPIQYAVKGFVVLTDKKKIFLEGITFLNKDSVVLFSPGTNIIEGAFTYKGDVRGMLQQNISVSAIQRLKLKRQSFASGAMVGAGGGFMLGYLAGAVSYKDDFYETDEDNDQMRNARALIFGFASALPTGLAGGIVGGLFIKKRFRINGDQERLEKVLNKIH